MRSLHYRDVLRRTKGFKKTHPKIYEKLIREFKNMASGGDGGILFQSHSGISVRKHYYENWANEDFTRLIKDLGEK